MRTSVEALPRFKNRLKRLERKYRTAVGQVQKLIEQLERGERPGDRIPGVGSVVYKERLRNPAVPGGKPKGYRVHLLRTTCGSREATHNLLKTRTRRHQQLRN